MQALEDELQHRGGERRKLRQPQALQGLLHAGQLAKHGRVAIRRLPFRDLESEAGIEPLDQLRELVRFEMPA